MNEARYVPNPTLEPELQRSIQVTQAMAEQAKKAETVAKRIAPVMTGKYRDSIGVRVDSDGVNLVSSDFKSNWIEFGTTRLAPKAVLRRAAETIGRLVSHGSL